MIMKIIHIDGIPCIVVQCGTFSEEYPIIIIDFTTTQMEKEKNFLEEVIEELEKLFDEMKNADQE